MLDDDWWGGGGPIISHRARCLLGPRLVSQIASETMMSWAKRGRITWTTRMQIRRLAMTGTSRGQAPPASSQRLVRSDGGFVIDLIKYNILF